jgi:O-antigen/teichoic acid export membrane protein
MILPGVKKNLVYYFILSASQVLLPLISIPYLSRVLDPSGVGKVSFIDSLAYFFVAIAEFGITVYGTREVARHREHSKELSKIISELLLLHVITSAVTVLIYSITLLFVYEKVHDWRLILFSLLFLIINAVSCEWFFLGTERFRYISSRSVFIRLIAVCAIFLFVRRREDYYIYYAIITASAISIAVLNISVLFKQYSIKLKDADWKHHIPYIWVTYIISLMTGILLYLDNVLLGLLSTAYAVGLYAFAMRIVRVSGNLISDPLQVFFPRIVNLIRNEKFVELQTALLRCVQLLTTFSVPLFVGTYLLADEIVQIILGPGFTGSANNLRILSIYPFLRSHNLFISRHILIAHGRENMALRSLGFGSIALIILIFVLAPDYKDIGVCIAVILSELTMLLVNYSFARSSARDIRFFDWKCFYKSVLSAVLFIPVVYAIKWKFSSNWIILSSSVIICVMLYVVLQVYVFRNIIILSLKRSGLNFFGRMIET